MTGETKQKTLEDIGWRRVDGTIGRFANKEIAQTLDGWFNQEGGRDQVRFGDELNLPYGTRREMYQEDFMRIAANLRESEGVDIEATDPKSCGGSYLFRVGNLPVDRAVNVIGILALDYKMLVERVYRDTIARNLPYGDVLKNPFDRPIFDAGVKGGSD